MNIKSFMRKGGESLQVARGRELLTVEGIRTHDKRKVLFEPGTDVQPGDWLTTESGHRYYVHDTSVQMYDQRPFSLEASYQTEAEQEAASEPQAATFNIFGNTYGSNIGTQQNAQVLQPTFTFGDLELEIERRGGDDAEALKEMVSEVRATLENQDSLSRGRLMEWSALLNEHSWITGPIAQLLLIFATTGQIS